MSKGFRRPGFALRDTRAKPPNMSLLQAIAAVWLVTAVAYLATMVALWLRARLRGDKDDGGRGGRR